MPGISPAGGEITRVTVVAESAADICARDALLDRAMGPRWRKKSSEKLRRGRLPAEGLAFVARDVAGRVVGTVRLWDVAFGGEVALPLIGKDGARLPPPFIPPHKGEGGHARCALPSGNSGESAGGASAIPSPLWGGIKGGGGLAPSRPMKALLLGPLAVDPGAKSGGIGSALMRHAIDEAKRLGHGAILLVGDAAYYERFGFSAQKTGELATPGPYERHRLLGLELAEGALDGARGTLVAAGRRVARERVRKVA
nr:N-acetyltransferase [Aliihoeflea sp. 2WW]